MGLAGVSTESDLDWGQVLRAIAAAEPLPWFASEYAISASIPRAELDEPLIGLRTAGLVEVVDWVRGKGQAVKLTTEGRNALKLPRLDIPVAPAPKPRPAETGPTTFERGEQARNALYIPRRAVATPLFIAAIIIWFLVGIWYSASTNLGSYLRGTDGVTANRLGAVSGIALTHGEWWRLGSSVMVHMGLVHLAMNLMGLGTIGPLVENLWGRTRFLIIALLSGTCGAAVAMIFRPDSLLAGASGAIWGLLLSVPAWLIRYRSHIPPDHIRDIGRRLGFGLIVNGGISFAPGVSFEAHFAGGAAGFLVAIVLDALRTDSRMRSLPATAVLVLLPLLVGVSLKRTMDRSSAWASLRYYEELRTKTPQADVQVLVPHYQLASRLHREVIAASAFQLSTKLKAMRPAVVQFETDAKAFLTLANTMAMKPEVLAYATALVRFAEKLTVLVTEAKPITAADRTAATEKLNTLRTTWAVLGIPD